MIISERVSNKIANMGFLCSLLVVSIHIGWDPQDGRCAWLLDEFVKEGIARIAVPFFFLISGYFLASHFDDPGWWRRENCKRVHSLLLPYVIWSMIYWLAAIPVGVAADVIARRALGSSIVLETLSPIKIFGLNISDQPIMVSLWYVRALIILVMLSGFFRLFRRSLFLLLMFIPLVFLFDRFSVPGRDPWWLSVWRWGLPVRGACYFFAGIWICSNQEKVSRMKRFFSRRLIGILLPIVGAAMLVVKSQVSSPMYVLEMSLPILILSAWLWIPDTKWCSFITGSSFPIYLMHLVAIKIFGFLPIASGFRRDVVMYVIAVIVPICVSMLVHKAFPRIGRVLFGGR